MSCMWKMILASAFLLTLVTEPALAVGSIRCGTHIISSGDRQNTKKYEVLKKCGEPTIREGDTWIYELPGATRRVVVFDASGRVMRIS